MAELKTKPNEQSVDAFLTGIAPEWKQEDAKSLLQLMHQITKDKPTMWGDSMVGFGNYHYKYKSGREGNWFITGFSPRKQNLTIYLMGGFDGLEDLLEQLGKYKRSSGCLYVKRLSDINLKVLEKMIHHSIQTIKTRYAEFN